MKKLITKLSRLIYKILKNCYFRSKLIIETIGKSKKIFLVGIPHHGNLGDQAILIAEEKFIKDNYKDYKIVEIASSFVSNDVNFVKKFVKKSPLLVHGGGYLGTLWLNEEKMFRNVLINFNNNPIILFPQTIYFENDEQGKIELAKSQEIYQSHNNLKIFLREKFSYDFMRENFPKCKIFLVPDIVLYLNHVNIEQNRQGILFCMRNDKEKVNDFKNEIEEYLKSKNINKIDYTDTIINKKIYGFNRKKFVNNKIKQFSGYKIVITDRLHGMIFALLSKTPCLVFQNKSPKIIGVYEWIKNVDYIRLSTKESYKEDLKFLEEYKNNYDNCDVKEKFDSLATEIKNVIK